MTASQTPERARAAVATVRPYLRVVATSPGEPSPIRRFVEFFALLALFAVSVELVCRIEDWVQYRTPLLARERSQGDLLIRDALGMHGRPGGRFQKWSLNSFGMRGPEVSQTKGSNIVRIVTAGASETFGLYESPGKEYPRQLEDSLDRRFSRSVGACEQPKAQVLNAAMPGMSLPTIEQDIRLRVRSLRPDYIVVYATPPGYLYDQIPVAAAPDSARRSAPQLAFVNALTPRVADRLRTQLKGILPDFVQERIRRREIRAMLASHPKGWRFETPPTDRIDAYQAELRRVVGAIRGVGAIPVVMTHANRFVGSSDLEHPSLRTWEKFYPRASGRTIVAFDSLARLATIKVARDSAAVLVDLAATLAKTRGASFADYAHFDDLGGALTASTLAESISASYENGTKCRADAR